MPVHVIPYHDKRDAIDTTSRSKTWSRGLSPFFLGPCHLYGTYTARNVENGWQFCKVHVEYDLDGEPTPEYFEWARKGWANPRAIRYPMGKGRKPLYSYWDGVKMDYVTARKKIYIPLYAKAVVKTEAFKRLKTLYDSNNDVTLRDFDGYDHIAQKRSLQEVIKDPNRKCGHAFVLAMLLTPPEQWDKLL